MSRNTWLTVIPVMVLSLVGSPTRADLPGLRFDRLVPLGGAAGSTVEVEITGSNVEEITGLIFDHKGFQAKHLKDRKYQVSIAADVPPGTYDVRLIGPLGVSNPRLFRVSQGLAEVLKKEPNEPANPQEIRLNTAVNGVCAGNRVDVYRFPARKGQRVVVEVEAGKLDSMMDATLNVTTVGGRSLGSNGGYNGRDPLVDLVIPEDGDYLVRVNDLSYRGGFPYRLLVHDLPQIATLYPRVVQTGTTTPMTVLGRNLGPAGKPSEWREFDLPLDQAGFSFTAPARTADTEGFTFREHPTDHNVLPTAATFTVRGLQVEPVLGDRRGTPQPVLLVDDPVTLEREPNDSAEKAMPIVLPAVVAGRFDRQRDVDWYEFETTEAGTYSFEVYCERIAGRADPFLVVVDPKGNRILELDDLGPRYNAFDGHLRDPSGTVNLAAKTKYRVLVQERYSRGGPRLQYVLTARKAEPDFHIAAFHSRNPGPGGTTVRAGGAIHLDVVTQGAGGFREPVVVTAENLPPGLHARPTAIRGTSGVFVLWAEANAVEWTGAIRLVATAQVGDRTIRRVVRPYTRVWSEANMNSSRPTRELVVAIRPSAPFALGFEQDRIEIPTGEKASIKVRLQRLAPDVREKVGLLPVNIPGLQVASSEVASGAEEGMITVTVPANTSPGEYTLTLMGQTQVPFSKDAKSPKANVLVSLPARPMTVVVLPRK